MCSSSRNSATDRTREGLRHRSSEPRITQIQESSVLLLKPVEPLGMTFDLARKPPHWFRQNRITLTSFYNFLYLEFSTFCK